LNQIQVHLNSERLNEKASIHAMFGKEVHELIKRDTIEENCPYLRSFFFGIKHGYPICCILFFLKGHNFFHHNDEYNEYCEQSELNLEYVLCPDCLVKKIGDLS
jgi:hypothetical protein